MFEAITDVLAWIVSAPFILLGWIIVGALAGEFGRRITGATDRSFFADFGLGIIGAILGGFIAAIVGVGLPAGGLPLFIANLFIATLGAALVIIIHRALTSPKQQQTLS